MVASVLLVTAAAYGAGAAPAMQRQFLAAALVIEQDVSYIRLLRRLLHMHTC